VSFYLHAPPSHLSFCCPFHETAPQFLFIIYANVPCNTHTHPEPWLNFTKALKSAYIFSKLIFSLTCLRQFIHITVYNYHVIISVMHMSTLWHHAQFIFLSEEILVDFSITVFQYLVKCQCKCLCILSWHAGIEIPLAIRRAVDLWFMVFYNITSNHFRNQIALCKNENHMSKSSYCFRYFPVYAIITSLIFSNL
jgi:hypothetical protein